MGEETKRGDDAEDLKRLGYAQQLLRDMGGFSNFALSFSIISILTGAVTLYGHGLTWGGPREMTLGWPLVTVMTMFVAASLAELASAFPTAGALYHWASILGGRGAGWLTAWMNVIGQFAITAGIDYGLADFLAHAFHHGSRGAVLFVYALLLASHAALNHVGVRVVALLNDLSAWYHLLGVAAVVVALLLFAPAQPLSFLMTTHRPADHSLGYAFAIGLLQAQWTFTGYDASAHVTEETRDPRRNAPWGMVLSVAISGIFGWIMLLAVTRAIPSVDETLKDANPFAYVLLHAVHGRLGVVLLWIVMGAMWFCGLSSTTSNSRMLFAFARDGGTPMSKTLASVSPRFKTPAVAVWVSACAAFVVALWSGAYSAVVALSTIALYASYAVPIVVGLRARRSGRWTTRGPWHLGRWSTAINVIAIGWVAIVGVLFVLPPNVLAGCTFGGALLVLAIAWFSRVKSRFAGPPPTRVT